MPLPDLFAARSWAIKPDALETWFHTLSLLDGSTQAENAVCSHAAGQEAKTASAASEDVSARPYSMHGRVALIEANGVIYKQSGGFSFFGMDISWEGQDRIRSALKAAMADQAAGAVLLSFDSPGGIASGVEELASFIAAQTSKPVYAYADGLCASAAYWLASATGRVYAPRTAEVGSIGVLQVHCDRSGANAQRGLHYTYITGGAWKAVGNPDTPLSGSDQAYLQKGVNDLHDVFRGDVAGRMPVDKDSPDLWGDAQVFMAPQAKALGLLTGIVPDREALLAHINKEIHMDKEELARAHPELLAQIRDEAGKEAVAAAAAQQQTEAAACRASWLAAVEAVCGADAANKALGLVDAKFTAEQIRTMASTFTLAVAPAGTQAVAQDEKSASSVTRAEILAAIQNNSTAPLNTSAAVSEGDARQAAIARIAGLGGGK